MGPMYKLEVDYDYVDVWVNTRFPCQGSGVIVDVLLDGVSIFSTKPQVTKLQSTGTGILSNTQVRLGEDSIVSLSLDQVDGAEGDITVGLILEED